MPIWPFLHGCINFRAVYLAKFATPPFTHSLSCTRSSLARCSPQALAVDVEALCLTTRPTLHIWLMILHSYKRCDHHIWVWIWLVSFGLFVSSRNLLHLFFFLSTQKYHSKKARYTVCVIGYKPCFSDANPEYILHYDRSESFPV